jgi:muconolactone delta-isomerase
LDTIVGLGNAGCNIAEHFSSYSQYKIFRIDSKERTGARFYKMPVFDSPEEYEKKCPSLKGFFRGVKGECLFIMAGSGYISGCSLAILKQLHEKKCDIHILYVKTDTSLLAQNKQLQERATFQVLQQYARSGIFKKMYVVDNSRLEQILGPVPINEYYDRLNQLISSTFHMVNIFNNSEPVMSSFSEPTEVCKISTLGIISAEDNKENLFFDLQMQREKVYYYAINSDKLDTDAELLFNIKKQLREKVLEDERTKISYGIFSTEYEEDYIYCSAHASFIQGQDLLEKNEISS